MTGEILSRLDLYDDIAVYIPGFVALSLLSMVVFQEAATLLNGHGLLLLAVLSFPAGLAVQSVASVLQYVASTLKSKLCSALKRENRAVKPNDLAYSKLSGPSKYRLESAFDMQGASKIATRCITEYSAHMPNYAKFRALSDVTRSLALVSAVFLFLVACLWIDSFNLHCMLARWYHQATLAETVIASFLSLLLIPVLVYRSNHYHLISSTIVFDVALSRLAKESGK